QAASPPRPLRDIRPDLPEAFIRAVERALKAKPEDRYASVGAFESALSDTMAVPPPSGSVWRRPGALALLGALVVVAVLAALLYARRGAEATQATAPAA